jgi:hypothetical protein
VNAPPVITAPISVIVQQSKLALLGGISLADVDAVRANETISITLSDQKGLLSASGADSITGSRTTRLMIAGTLAQVNADLATPTDRMALSGPTLSRLPSMTGAAAARRRPSR